MPETDQSEGAGSKPAWLGKLGHSISAKLMVSIFIAMQIDTISLALMLWPSLPSHAGLEPAPSDWSVSGMDRHRKLRARALQLREYGRTPLYFGKDRQVTGCQPKDGKAEGDEHGGDRDLGPLRRIASPDSVFDAGDGDVEAIGDETQQRKDCD